MLAALDDARAALRGRVRELADEGHRVLLVATRARRSPASTCRPTSSRRGSSMLGDRPRPDAAETLRYFRDQDVTVKVISGDDPRTVGAIAGQPGPRRRR